MTYPCVETPLADLHVSLVTNHSSATSLVLAALAGALKKQRMLHCDSGAWMLTSVKMEVMSALKAVRILK